MARFPKPIIVLILTAIVACAPMSTPTALPPTLTALPAPTAAASRHTADAHRAASRHAAGGAHKPTANRRVTD